MYAYIMCVCIHVVMYVLCMYAGFPAGFPLLGGGELKDFFLGGGGGGSLGPLGVKNKVSTNLGGN